MFMPASWYYHDWEMCHQGLQMSFSRTKLRVWSMAHASIFLLTKSDKLNETQLVTSTATSFRPSKPQR